METSDGHLLKKFFIQVNRSQESRMHFLLDPIPFMQKALPNLELTTDMIEDINEIREKLIEVHGIAAIPPGIKGLIDNLKEGTDLPKSMDDDSVVI